MKKLFFIVLVFINISLFADGVLPTGAGTETDPYQIETLDNLLWVSSDSTSWDSYFEQTTDIDASATSGWNEGAGFIPIGVDNTNPFSGNYDGQEYVIDGLFINKPAGKTGLFGYTDTATISNLGVTNVDISSNSQTAALVGFNTNSTITNCNSSGNVTGDWTTAGLVGRNDTGIITECYSSVNVDAEGDHNGGLVGSNSVDSTIENCYATGNIIGYDEDIAGLVGENNDNSIINNCYSTGNVSGGTAFVGGLVGRTLNGATTTNSFWDTVTSGQSTSAGGTGKTTAEMKDVLTYIVASWDFTGETTNGNDDDWGMNLSENGGYPFLVWQNLSHTEYTPLGSGTGADPFQISSLPNLHWLSNHSSAWDSHFIQTADIDASTTSGWNSGAGFSPIGTSYLNFFTGNYDGQGYEIDGLYINRPSTDYQGLFGKTFEAEISNLGVTNVDVSGDEYVGGLVGYNSPSSSITSSYSTGSVSGDEYVGGLVGVNHHSSSITSSYSTGSVTGVWNVGGLVGVNYSSSSITSSYSTGSVSGSYYVGGLVGGSNDYASVNNSYSTGNVSGGTVFVGGLVGANHNSSSVNNSFWDTETSGQSSSDGGTGKTTAEMQVFSTFLNAGWDFIGETNNGSDDIWGLIYSDNGYPFLMWQGYSIDYLPEITIVSDVPGDQGRHINVSWNKSSLDAAGSIYPIVSYNLWIEYPFETRGCRISSDINEIIDHYSDNLSKRPENKENFLLDRDGEVWVIVLNMAAMQWNSYTAFTQTYQDSSSTEDNPSTFFVSAHTTTPSLYFISNIMSGYSLDNIAPNAAANVAVAVSNTSRNNTLALSWDEVTEGSYQGNSYPEQNGIWYKIYASDNPDFVCDENTYLETTQDLSIDVDVTGENKMFFKIIVSDQE